MGREKRLLLPGEQVIKESDNGVVALTNYRVRFDAAAAGSAKYVSIPLEAVASCGLTTNSRPSLLIAAGIAALIAFVQPDSAARYLLLLGALVLLIIYFAMRSAVLIVSSSGGEAIVVPAKGMSRDEIVPFLEAIVEARLRLPKSGVGERSSAFGNPACPAGSRRPSTELDWVSP